MSHALPFRLTLLAAALSITLPAYAQQAETPAKPEAPLKKSDEGKVQKVEVRGSAASYDPRRDDTASKIVVNHDEIVKYGDTNVLDVMKRLPGITVSGNAIRMRGLGSGYTQVLVNGERAPAGFSIESLAPDSIERIEVLRAASAEFSTQSIAGTVNIILKKAVSKAQREIKAGVGGGKGSIQPSFSLQLSDRIDKFSYSLAVNLYHFATDRDYPTIDEAYDLSGRLVGLRNIIGRNKTRFDGLNIGPRLNWTLGNGDTLTSQSFINASRFNSSATESVQTLVGSEPAYPNVDMPSDNRNSSIRTDLNYVKKLGDSAKFDVKAGASYSRSDSEQRRLGYRAGEAPGFDSRYVSDGDEKGYTTTGKYSAPVGEGHSIAAGWDLGYSELGSQRMQRNIVDAGLPEIVDENYAADVTRVAVYGQDEWNVTPRWSVYLGARWEGIRTASAGSGFDTATSTTRVLSPIFQTLYKLPGTKSDQLRFAITRTYKAPSTQSLVPRRHTSVNNSASDPDYMGNPNLKPELALGFDGSYEHYWAEGALLSASVSAREIDDYTRSTRLLGADGRWVVMPLNGGKAHTRSIELEAKFPLKAVMDNAPAIDLRASVSRNWSSVDSVPGPNNRLDNQTPVSANLGIDYKSGALTAGGSFNFATGGLVRVSAEQTRYESVRRALDAYALWKFSPKTQVRLSASNLLGQDFVSDGTYTDRFGSTRRVSVFPNGVTARAMLEVKF